MQKGKPPRMRLRSTNRTDLSKCSRVNECAHRPGLPLACRSGWLACLDEALDRLRATLAAAPVFFTHAFGSCHMEKHTASVVHKYRRVPKFHPMAQCVVNALEGLACRASPSHAPFWSMPYGKNIPYRLLTNITGSLTECLPALSSASAAAVDAVGAPLGFKRARISSRSRACSCVCVLK